jgi:methionine biosynthesis protein MetW
MSVVKNFYTKLWQKKVNDREIYQKEYQSRRDWFHKYFMDYIINPNTKGRHEVVREILPSGQRILDVGCWGGESLKVIGASNRFKEVYGVDVIEESVQRAHANGLKAYVVDLNKDPLPFEAGFFDCVLMLDVLEHLIDPYEALSEIARVMRVKGVVIICTPNVASLSNRVRILMGKRPRTSFDPGWDGGHLCYFTPGELSNLVGEYGLKVIEKRVTGGGQWLKRLLFSMTGEFILKCEKVR